MLKIDFLVSFTSNVEKFLVTITGTKDRRKVKTLAIERFRKNSKKPKLNLPLDKIWNLRFSDLKDCYDKSFSFTGLHTQAGNLHGLGLGDAALEENRSDVSEDAAEAVEPCGSEVSQIGESASRASLGEEGAEAADGDVTVGREERFEVGLVAEFGDWIG